MALCIQVRLLQLHLVVADQDFNVASIKVIIMEFFNVDYYTEFIVIYPDERRISPDSMYLQLTTPLE